jgi:hypothetical protein
MNSIASGAASASAGNFDLLLFRDRRVGLGRFLDFAVQYGRGANRWQLLDCFTYSGGTVMQSREKV